MKKTVSLLLAVLGLTLPAFATVNTFYYWHMGESDPGAANLGACSNTVDSVAKLMLTNTPTTNGGFPNYPVYSTNVSLTATTNSGSNLSVKYLGGQYGS